ncbi:hypothetical protein [Priestia abyssalis]|uniref:hypothetical protein n=1 Tax=Priestia abyssalis TaxID=1221450 RepID=UPI00099576FC|nr:hypothetical protein [Priestia abyssalis]
MPLWLFIITICSGLLGLGAFIDFKAKKKNIRIELEEGIKNASDSEQIYTEQYLDQARKEAGENNPF